MEIVFKQSCLKSLEILNIDATVGFCQIDFDKTRRSKATARVIGLSDQEAVVQSQEQQKPLVLLVQKIPNQNHFLSYRDIIDDTP
jgi:hypothetical protein